MALQQGETIRIIALLSDGKTIDEIYEDKVYRQRNGSLSSRTQRFFELAIDRLNKGNVVVLEKVKTPDNHKQPAQIETEGGKKEA